MTRNRLSSENWCSDWRACYGGCVAPPPSRAAWFRSRGNTCFSFRQRRQAHQGPTNIIDSTYRNAVATEEAYHDEPTIALNPRAPVAVEPADQGGHLTRSFVRLSNLPTYPLDRLSRYEATLWRQACQILFTLQCLDQRKPWERLRLR